jgi:hypothetical protein
MSGRLSNLRIRLAKVEGQVADRAKREKLANCNCSQQEWLSFFLVQRNSKQQRIFRALPMESAVWED